MVNCSIYSSYIIQIMAIVVILLGLPVSLLFQLGVTENPNATHPQLKWYRWFLNPKFYLVSI